MAARKAQHPRPISRACSACERAAIERRQKQQQIQREFQQERSKFRIPNHPKKV